MRILCVIDSLGSGGAQRQLVNLAIGFKESGHDVSFLVYHKINFFKATLIGNNIPVKEIITPNYYIRLIKMRRFIRAGGFDAILSFLEAANFICEVAGLPHRKWKLVVGERSANPIIYKSLKRRFYRWFHLLADFVIANSYENIKIVRDINPFLSDHKCHVINNIVDFEKWKPSEDYIPLKEGKLEIIIVASHQYLKNLNGLVEAMNMLNKNEKSNLSIKWFGENTNDGSKQDGIRKINNYGLNKIITFHEPIIDIHKKVQLADAVVLLSFVEGLPNIVCEAMATGKVVLASRVSDIAKLISNKNLLVNPKNPQSIYSGLKYLIEMQKKDLIDEGNRNRIVALKLFQKKDIIQHYLNLLQN